MNAQSIGPRRQSAFSLIELLIVISIIAILAALLFPVGRGMMLRSQQVASLNNLRQWGTALGSSLAEHNNTMPWDGQPVNLERADAWYNRLPKYMGERSLKELQGANALPRAGVKSVWVNPALPASLNQIYPKYLFSYAENYYLSGTDSSTKPASKFTTLRMTRVAKPTVTVFMAEKSDDFANCNPSYIKAYFGKAHRLPDGSASNDFGNAANFLFCDGHVALIERSKFAKATATKNNPPDPEFTFVPFELATSS